MEKDDLDFTKDDLNGSTPNVLSPFSPHEIKIWDETFQTLEHAYQTSKLKPGPDRDKLKDSPTAFDVWQNAKKYADKPEVLNPQFDKEKVMEELFRTKLAQYPEIKSILKESGTRRLVAGYENGLYWGLGKDGLGKNRLGELWMKLRAEL